MGSRAPVGVQAGDVLANKYRVERVLGAGGMGVVLAAHHLQLDTPVAIKLLLPEMLTNADAVARFTREARAAARIANEHVARVVDVATLENGAPYMVMEYLQGCDLSARIQQHGPFSVEEAVETVLQACEALAEAHSLGIVHRDLKPANLFCVTRSDGMPFIKVLDFGISKYTSPGASSSEMAMTRTTTTMGSPLYMSPEQMESTRNVDARTDVWALGVILHELVTGQTPFQGDTLPELCVKISTRPAPRLRTLRPDIPAVFEAVVLRCLEKDKNVRFQSVAELAYALSPFARAAARTSIERIMRTGGGSRAASSPDAAGLFVPGGLRPETLGPVGNTRSGRRGHRGVVAQTTMAVVALVLVLGIGVTVQRTTSRKVSITGAEHLQVGSTIGAVASSVPGLVPVTAPSGVTGERAVAGEDRDSHGTPAALAVVVSSADPALAPSGQDERLLAPQREALGNRPAAGAPVRAAERGATGKPRVPAADASSLSPPKSAAPRPAASPPAAEPDPFSQLKPL